MLALAVSLIATTEAVNAAPQKEGPPTVEARGALSQRLAGSIPPKVKASCTTKWCENARTVRKVAVRVHRALAGYGSPMAGLANAFEMTRAAKREGRSVFAMLGIAGAESTLGKASCGFNTTGLGSCWASGNWKTITLCGKTFHGPTYVSSWARGIGLTARLIRCLLPKASTVYELYGYCVDCPTWAGNVAAIMRQYFKSGPGVLWKDARAAVA